mgnify:CR=1 FL=1
MTHGRVTPAASRFNQVSHSGKKTFQLEQLAYFIFRRRGRRTDIILYSLFIIIFKATTLIISKKPGNTGFSRDIRTEFTTDLLLSD